MSKEYPIGVETIGEDTFDLLVTSNGRLVLVDFYADWCGPCKTMAPRITQLANTYREQLAVYKVNVDQAPALVRRLAINAIPTLMLFKQGAVLGTLNGAHHMRSLRVFIEQHAEKGG